MLHSSIFHNEYYDICVLSDIKHLENCSIQFLRQTQDVAMICTEEGGGDPLGAVNVAVGLPVWSSPKHRDLP